MGPTIPICGVCCPAQESHICSHGHFTGPGNSVVEHSVELCSSNDFSLSLLTPLLDLVWDVEIPVHTVVEGPAKLPLEGLERDREGIVIVLSSSTANTQTLIGYCLWSCGEP